eukprot:scaffold13084_cov69-Cylindrotheca_fusiformis.AAC.2
MSIGGFIGIRKNSRARPKIQQKPQQKSERLMRITPPSSSGVGGTRWPAILVHCLQIKRKRGRPLGLLPGTS